ncbi:HIRAN domain-containing protein [Ensifer aridi]|uniref:HIRAN domain-containing protein n=1 Tax=Ensifer aridi TaxID=1708715 RepID=UPI000A11F579|nr:HIRAN domain-containing protein [Ensifer aridi]
MGFWQWLFGTGGGKPIVKVALPSAKPGRFAKDRYAPDGKWVQTTIVESVVGVRHRFANAAAFAEAARNAERFGQLYGVTLEPQPDNVHDRNAIAVHGQVGTQKWHVGYLDRELAAELNRDLLSKDIPIAAELYEIWVGDTGLIDIKVIVLAPPGNSMKVRLKQSRESASASR